MTDGPFCTHQRVNFTPHIHEGGTFTDHWRCECGQAFAPILAVDRALAAEARAEQVERERDAARLATVQWAAVAERRGEALRGLHRGSCFCEVGIGNPMMRGEHSHACVDARAALAPTPCGACEGKGDVSCWREIDDGRGAENHYEACPACSGTGEAKADVREALCRLVQMAMLACADGRESGLTAEAEARVDVFLASLPAPPADALREHDAEVARKTLEAAADELGVPDLIGAPRMVDSPASEVVRALAAPEAIKRILEGSDA